MLERNDVLSAEGVISLGINDDWNFEDQISSITSCKVVAADKSIGRVEFLKRALRRCYGRFWLF